MPIIQPQVSSTDLLHSAEHLPLEELEQFVAKVIALRARRVAKSLSTQESKLLTLINHPVPVNLQQRYDELTIKQGRIGLDQQEISERIQIIEKIESFDAERLQHLATLARLRQISLPQLMHDLGIQQPDYV
ncbi:hypothetical protein [Thiofilum flexile]|uniref:hypothetical protein n=1 Tax=Thiofilum flexile TaxID=125627 RepID=UPI000377B3F9|nr:hypothetical protein [Thiofilum flexile]